MIMDSKKLIGYLKDKLADGKTKKVIINENDDGTITINPAPTLKQELDYFFKHHYLDSDTCWLDQRQEVENIVKSHYSSYQIYENLNVGLEIIVISYVEGNADASVKTLIYDEWNSEWIDLIKF